LKVRLGCISIVCSNDPVKAFEFALPDVPENE